MTPRRSVSLLLAVAATTMLVTGTFGFTSVSADRNVSISVVESDDAYVDVSVCANPTSQANASSANPVDVTVSNQFSEAFTVESVEWGAEAHPNRTVIRPRVDLEPGESTTFENTFGTESVTVTVSGGLEATVTVEVGPRCSKSSKGAKTENGTSSPTPTET